MEGIKLAFQLNNEIGVNRISRPIEALNFYHALDLVFNDGYILDESDNAYPLTAIRQIKQFINKETK